MRDQRRGLRIAMTPEEVDEFLGSERTCRVATVGASGAPHVSPLWFVWDGAALWMTSIVKSQRWTNLMRDPRLSLIVDDGTELGELRGVEIHGRAEAIGDVPQTSLGDPRLAEPERLFGEKYLGGTYATDGRHAWLRVVPEAILSWDFRKMAAS